MDGCLEGWDVGAVGLADGCLVGDLDGVEVGILVGLELGCEVGLYMYVQLEARLQVPKYLEPHFAA